MQNVGVKGLTNLKSDIAAIKELRQIEKDVRPDVIHLHSSVAGGLGRLAYKGKNNTVVYTPHGYAHILMGPGQKRKVYKFAEKVLGNRSCPLGRICAKVYRAKCDLCATTGAHGIHVVHKGFHCLINGFFRMLQCKFLCFLVIDIAATDNFHVIFNALLLPFIFLLDIRCKVSAKAKESLTSKKVVL